MSGTEQLFISVNVLSFFIRKTVVQAAVPPLFATNTSLSLFPVKLINPEGLIAVSNSTAAAQAAGIFLLLLLNRSFAARYICRPVATRRMLYTTSPAVYTIITDVPILSRQEPEVLITTKNNSETMTREYRFMPQFTTAPGFLLCRKAHCNHLYTCKVYQTIQ